MVTESEALKEEVAAACRIIGRLHLTREPNGHVSVRIPGSEHILIKARGPQESPLSFTTVDDLMVVSMDGKPISSREGLAPPSEVFIHTEVLRSRPDVNSVIHIHPPSVVAYTIAEKPILPIVGAYNPSALKLIREGIPTYPRSFLINSPDRGQSLVGAMGSARLCLMRGHGITTAGSTVEEATLTAIHLNDLAELHAKADNLGGAVPISDEDIADILGNLPSDVRRDSTIPRGASSEWRYYLQAFA